MPDQNMMILTSAYLNGAMVIEKHFSDTKGVKGNDHFHSLNKNDLINLDQILIYIIQLIKILKKEKF